MKTTNRYYPSLLLIALFLIGGFTAKAGKRIDGNGKIVTQQKTVEQFYQIELSTFCNVFVNTGSMPMVSLKVDENLQDIYQIKVVDGVLKVSTDEWPEPTQLQLTVQVPFITSFRNSGWGTIQINGLNTERFALYATTGKVKLNGKVEQLTIEAGTGKIDASEMKASTIELLQSSHGTTQLGVCETLSVQGRLGTVTYQGNPTLSTLKAERSLVIQQKAPGTSSSNKQRLKYISITIRNNALWWNNFVIRGPKVSPFSYGFSMLPFTQKEKRVPIGTAFYSENIEGQEQLLYRISSEDENKTVNLFQ